MYKIITIVSARPQFIKAVVLSRAIGESLCWLSGYGHGISSVLSCSRMGKDGA